MPKNQNLASYDMCCGAGVFSLGFKRAGFKVIGGVDIDKYAIDTASLNIPEGKWNKYSIEEYSRIMIKGNNSYAYKANVIIAGLPCQGFSVAGKWKDNDPRNQLYRYLLKIVRKVKPVFVVVENVNGLLSEKNETVFKDMYRGLEKLGYDVEHRVYNAMNFGVPQIRKRVFIMASLDTPVRFVFSGVRFSNDFKTVKDALAGLDEKREDSSINHTFMKHSRKVISKIRRIKKSGPISYKRLSNKEPSFAIISGHNALSVHPKQHRAISNREAARIQGIPDSFIFSGPRTAQTIQVANAVPMPLAFVIAKAIRNSTTLMKSWQGKLFRKLLSRTDLSTSISFKKGFVNFFRKKGRDYPWRNTRDPYKVLLSEILLQRTKSSMVEPVWKESMQSIKTVKNGYQLNSRKLKKVFSRIGIFNRLDTIKELNADLVRYFAKKVPKNFDELMNLSGVGLYMAAAVRTFAFNIPDFPVDSNAFRFTSRFYGTKIQGKKSEARQIREFMNTIIDPKRPKEFVYGFLDFCAAVCTPRNPLCNSCFLKKKCKYNK